MRPEFRIESKKEKYQGTEQKEMELNSSMNAEKTAKPLSNEEINL